MLSWNNFDMPYCTLNDGVALGETSLARSDGILHITQIGNHNALRGDKIYMQHGSICTG